MEGTDFPMDLSVCRNENEDGDRGRSSHKGDRPGALHISTEMEQGDTGDTARMIDSSPLSPDIRATPIVSDDPPHIHLFTSEDVRVEAVSKLMLSWFHLGLVKIARGGLGCTLAFEDKVKVLVDMVLPVQGDDALARGMAFQARVWLRNCLAAQELYYGGLVEANLRQVASLTFPSPMETWNRAYGGTFTDTGLTIPDGSLFDLFNSMPQNFWASIG